MRFLRNILSLLLLAVCFAMSYGQTPKLTWGEWDSSAITTFLHRTGGDMLSVIKVCVPNSRTVRFASRELVEQKNIGNCEYVIVVRPKISQLSVAIDDERPIVIDMRNPYRFGFRERKGYTLTIGEPRAQVDEQEVPVDNNRTSENKSSVTSNSDYKIKEFKELPTDISARTNQVLDADGVPCALIKVRIPISGVEFQNSVKVDYKPGEYWVYMRDEVSEMFFSPNSDETIVVSFEEYDVEGLKSKTTYLMTIIPPQSEYIENAIAMDESFEDEDDESVDEAKFEDTLIPTLIKYSGILDYLYVGYEDFGYYFINFNDNVIFAASEAGWPDATSVLIDLLEGNQLPSRGVKYSHEELMEKYSTMSPRIKELFYNREENLSRLKKMLVTQQAILEAEISKIPNVTIPSYETSGSIHPTAYEKDRLKQLINEYNGITLAAYSSNHYASFSGNVFNGGTWDSRIDIFTPIHTGVWPRKYVSDVCKLYIDKLRERKWIALVEFYNKWKD